MRLVATKLLTPPERQGQVSRARLFHRLDGALTRPLTLVTAPAGFGKTTLVSAWSRQLPVRSAWLTLDEDDDVPGRFLDYLIAAVRADETAQTLLESSTSVPAVVAALVNDLAAATDDVVLVLDDFHAIGEPEILDAVGFLVDHCPQRLHLVLVGRSEPDLPLARWRGRGLVAEIGAAQLRFSADEAAALLRSVIGAEVGESTVLELHRRAEGWAAGLQMLGIGVRDGTSAAGPSMSAPSVWYRSGDRYVLDYLASEVVRGQSGDVREFLLHTSVLDRLTPSLCDAVTGRRDSDQVIRELERANLFLGPLDEAGEWHRYHGLFADYLRSELDPVQAARCHARAAAWFADREFPAETIKHAVAAGDVELAVRTVRSVVEDQVRRGELASLLSWLNRLPGETVRSHADLAGFKGWLLYLAGRADEAETFARIADAGMPADSPDRAMLLSFQAYLALSQGEPATAAALAGEVLDLLGDSTSFFRAAAMGVLGQARRLTGDRRGAIEVLRAAVRLGERSGNPLSTLEATGYLAPLLYAQGRMREAVLLCEEALDAHAVVAGRRLPMAGLAEVPLGTLRYERDELDDAKKLLVDGIARCEQLGTTSYTLLGLRTLARLHVVHGETDDGLRALLAARRQADAAEDHRRTALVIATIAELHLRTGNVAAAEQVLLEIDQPSTSDYEQLVRARLLVARNRPRSAVDTLTGVCARAVEQGRDGSRIGMLTVLALAHDELGDAAQARELLAGAVELAAPDGYRRTFLDEGAPLVPLLRDVRATAPGFVADLLDRAAAAPRPRASELLTVEGIGVVETLTDTQQRILTLIATGMSNREVAEKLFITVGTTKWHLNQIFGRLQVRNRTEAVARARELHLL
ncbi:helix-turn-helix transcriptional regulator [Lentzea tibetensis]|uniref:Helix-turn-helix transcriptional regulator n=1 Tax=Lentzea tibetensis TaxID=2591470 RepID=A0A563EQH3_9PSEU|nr:LuxR C-terminal-related transcriptional regulator [Lentzea tibetensis]TWP49478.1 helix-turn-helix transcriptional regulator [Lentzea tibetensis]